MKVFLLQPEGVDIFEARWLDPPRFFAPCPPLRLKIPRHILPIGWNEKPVCPANWLVDEYQLVSWDKDHGAIYELIDSSEVSR